jgi:hypothetical protein
MVEMLVELKVD